MGVEIITDPKDTTFGEPKYGFSDIEEDKQITPDIKAFEFKSGDNVNFPKVGDEVIINYSGFLKRKGTLKKDQGIKEKLFDSSIKRNKSLTCKVGVGQLIRGWDEGIPKLSLGQKATLSITSDYGYGSAGFGAVIPPNSDLIFDVELIGINDLLINPPSAEQPDNQNN